MMNISLLLGFWSLFVCFAHIVERFYFFGKELSKGIA
jgi:hypothetical protein